MSDLSDAAMTDEDSAEVSAPAHVESAPTLTLAAHTATGLDPAPTKPALTQPAPTPAPAAPEAQFAVDNHPRILTGIHGQLLPNGGTMHIRLDPPELGALQVTVHMRDGVMTAAFETSSDDATRLLSHSLTQLKHVLESQGVSVEKLHVQQSPRDQQSSNDESRQQRNPFEDSASRQEQQRREMLRRMWRRLREGSDPLDMVA
jgi:flagellar hook-length control protein FliK